MKMYDKILLPTDGSEGAEVAVEDAINLAERYDAELHVLYVADVRVDTAAEAISNIMGQMEDIGEEATDSIRQEAEENGIDTVAEVSRGIPHMEINSYTEENGIDLVVMGTHGRSGLDRLLLGSVTEKIVRTSSVPVMTVRRGE